MREKIEMKKKSTKKSFGEGYKEFILNCNVRNLSPYTIKHYDDIVNNTWYKFFSPEEPISEITSKTIDNFIMFMRTKTNGNDVTVNTNIRAIRAICYFFMRLGYLEEFKIQEIKFTKDIIETYSEAEIKLLLKKPDVDKCSFIEYRNWVVVNFLLATGCRISTLVNIKIQDLDFDNMLITYKHTKNRKQQIVPTSNSLKKVLDEYLQYRAGEREEYLFINAYGNKLKPTLLNENLRDFNRKRGVIKTGVHRWRHTFAKMWILEGGDIFRLQKILGHSSLDVVKEYVDMFTNDLQRDFNSFSPLEQMTENKKFIKMK